MIKRLQDSELRARTYWSQCRELVLRAITHNVMVVRRHKFSTEHLVRLSETFAETRSTVAVSDRR